MLDLKSILTLVAILIVLAAICAAIVVYSSLIISGRISRFEEECEAKRRGTDNATD